MIYVNNIPVEFTSFPNGETKMVESGIIPNLYDDVVTFRYDNDGDLIKLMFVKRYLDSLVADSAIRLRILYMPYSRMDRSEGGSAFTLRYVAEFINMLNFTKVFVLEPHSDVTPALLNNSVACYTTIPLLEDVENLVNFDKKEDFLFFPDAGAQKRYHALTGYKQLVGYKNRDFNTGKILSLEVVGDTQVAIGQKVIIMDDLSSYGTTFVKSAERLKEIGVAEIYLFVAHAEYNIFKGQIFESGLIDKVFTTDSILHGVENTGNLHIFKL